ncbi:MAG: glutamate-5-semialdehyde dehydrogenase [Clostridiales bacterium]|nr:glutamate-5-semialdehyde dehydrogenase [Clostridiales bacterium]
MTDFETRAKEAKQASFAMAVLPTDVKNKALLSIADALVANKEAIFAANAEDMKNAAETDLPMPLQKRLLFDDHKLNDVVTGLHGLTELPDPVGRELMKTEMDDDLVLTRVSCPIGVLGIIFESRPDALVQIASLALKSGNSCCLKGGSEAVNSNRVLFDVIEKASVEAGLPKGWIVLMETRNDVAEMLLLDQYIDLIIPRGSNAFVQYIMQHSSIPVMGHADGVCHLYIHEKADPEMALRIAVDSKTQYVAVCNACETILVDDSIASSFLPKLADALKEKNVELHGCEKTKEILPEVLPVEQWHHEYLDYKVSLKVVADMEEAIAHINRFGSGHTESIVTTDEAAAEEFMNRVDSGNVFWNCSTRFSDGLRYGFGAEVGISTSKLHARGPVGLEGLVTYKYKIRGNGNLVADYSNGTRKFTHKHIK